MRKVFVSHDTGAPQVAPGGETVQAEWAGAVGEREGVGEWDVAVVRAKQVTFLIMSHLKWHWGYLRTPKFIYLNAFSLPESPSLPLPSPSLCLLCGTSAVVAFQFIACPNLMAI